MAGVDSTNSTLPTEASMPAKSPRTDTTGLFRQPLTLSSVPSIPYSIHATPTSPPTMYSLTTGHLPSLHFQSSPSSFTTSYLPSCRYASSTTNGSTNTGSGSGIDRNNVVDLTIDDNDEGNQDCIVDLTSPTTTQPSIITTANTRLPRSRTYANSHCNISNHHDESNKYSTPDVSIVLLDDTPSPRKKRKLKSKGLTQKSATFPYPIQNHEASNQPEKATEHDKSSIIKCPICLESPAQFEKNGSKLVSTVCGHLFCSQCIRNTITTMHKCPTCRKKLSLKQYHQIFL